MISVHFQGKPFNIMVIQVDTQISNTEEAEVERFYEDLHICLNVRDLLLDDLSLRVGEVPW